MTLLLILVAILEWFGLFCKTTLNETDSITLDTIMKTYVGNNLNFLKIDCEGIESEFSYLSVVETRYAREIY